MKKLTALILALSLFASLSACGGSAEQEQPSAPVGSEAAQTSTQPVSQDEEQSPVVIATTIAWSGWDPTVNGTQANCMVYDLIYDRLVDPHADGVYTPRLATSWENSDDYMTAIFHLDENAVWHDGEPVTAEDVVWTVKYYTDPNGPSTIPGYFNYLVGTDSTGYRVEGEEFGAVAVDDHTVEFHLKQPKRVNAILDEMHRYFFTLPSHIYGQYTSEQLKDTSIWAAPVGSGPFIYAAEIAASQVEFTRNDNYWRDHGNVKNIIVAVKDSASLIAGLESGEVDVVPGFGSSISVVDWDTCQALSNVTSESIKTFAFTGMFINVSNEKLSDTRVRQAMNYAIDRETIVNQLLAGQGEVTYTMLPPSHPYYNQDLEVTSYDPEKARALLEEANWDFNTELTIDAATGIRTQLALLIQQYLSDIGMKTKVDTMDSNNVLANLRSHDFELGIMGASGTTSPYTQDYFVTAGHANNFGAMTDPTIGDLFAQAKSSMDAEEERELVNQAQQEIVDEAPIIFIFTTNNLSAFNNRLSNVITERWATVSIGAYDWVI